MGLKKVKMLQKNMKFERSFSDKHDKENWADKSKLGERKSTVICHKQRSPAVELSQPSMKMVLSKYQVCLYQQLQMALHNAPSFHPAFHCLPTITNQDLASKITGEQRDTAVNNVRFLHTFYGFSSDTFALAVNLLDRFLVRVKAHWRYLSCIANSCYYIAVKMQEEDEVIPSAGEVISLSQCSCSVSDLLRMERVILEKLQWSVNAVTPLTFVHYFFAIGKDSFPQQFSNSLLDQMESQLSVCLCQHHFTQFQSSTMALALFSQVLQETRVLSAKDTATLVLNLQFFCHVPDWEFMHCKGMIMDYLMLYHNQPTRKPQLHLVWVVSRRTLLQTRPSTRCSSDLSTIHESSSDDSDDDDFTDISDTGLFDSESETEDIPVKIGRYNHWS